MEKIWAIYDGRYHNDPDSATVFEMCESIKEARENKDDYGDNNVIVEYDHDGVNLLNPKIVE